MSLGTPENSAIQKLSIIIIICVPENDTKIMTDSRKLHLLLFWCHEWCKIMTNINSFHHDSIVWVLDTVTVLGIRWPTAESTGSQNQGSSQKKKKEKKSQCVNYGSSSKHEMKCHGSSLKHEMCFPYNVSLPEFHTKNIQTCYI